MIAGAIEGCSAHSPMIVKGTTDVTPISANKYPPHGNRVWVTRASLPPTLRFEVLGQLDVGKVWYGPAHEVLRSLADGARKLGADAVIEVRTWHQPSGWSWAAPHGSGKAVKILEPAPVDLRSLGGDWQ